MTWLKGLGPEGLSSINHPTFKTWQIILASEDLFTWDPCLTPSTPQRSRICSHGDFRAKKSTPQPSTRLLQGTASSTGIFRGQPFEAVWKNVLNLLASNVHINIVFLFDCFFRVFFSRFMMFMCWFQIHQRSFFLRYFLCNYIAQMLHVLDQFIYIMWNMAKKDM